MSTVSAPPARKIHLKKFAKASFAIIPLKSDCGVPGWSASRSAARPKTASVAAESRRARDSLLRQARSSRKSESVPRVSTSSGRNHPVLRTFSATRKGWMSIVRSPPRYTGRRFWMSICSAGLIACRMNCG